MWWLRQSKRPLSSSRRKAGVSQGFRDIVRHLQVGRFPELDSALRAMCMVGMGLLLAGLIVLLIR